MSIFLFPGGIVVISQVPRKLASCDVNNLLPSKFKNVGIGPNAIETKSNSLKTGYKYPKPRLHSYLHFR